MTSPVSEDVILMEDHTYEDSRTFVFLIKDDKPICCMSMYEF